MLRMSSPELIAEFRTTLANAQSPVEAAFLVGKIIDNAFDGAWCRAEFSRLAAAVPPQPTALIQHMHQLGFSGATDYYRAANSSVMEVLRTRRGIPISLAMVLIGVAEQLGLKAKGINFPRHFLVAINEVLVDPFAMQATDRDQCYAWLDANNIAHEAAFNVASPVDVAHVE
jgi:regulator of sirC expression with transglutaminase-like and TPR domain